MIFQSAMLNLKIKDKRFEINCCVCAKLFSRLFKDSVRSMRQQKYILRNHICYETIREQFMADTNVKVNLSLYLIKHHTMKTWGCESIAPLFLILALDKGDGQLHILSSLSLGKEP
jgi:hypothetical protein